MKKILLFLILCIFSFAGCDTAKRCNNLTAKLEKRDCPLRKQVIETHDTIEVKRYITDTIIEREGVEVKYETDSASLRALIECNDKGQVYLKELIKLQSGKNMKINVSIKDNLLSVDVKVDSNRVYQIFKERYQSRDFLELEKKISSSSKEKTIPTAYIPDWCKFFRNAAIIEFILLLITGYLLVRKLFS